MKSDNKAKINNLSLGCVCQIVLHWLFLSISLKRDVSSGFCRTTCPDPEKYRLCLLSMKTCNYMRTMTQCNVDYGSCLIAG